MWSKSPTTHKRDEQSVLRQCVACDATQTHMAFSLGEGSVFSGEAFSRVDQAATGSREAYRIDQTGLDWIVHVIVGLNMLTTS